MAYRIFAVLFWLLAFGLTARLLKFPFLRIIPIVIAVFLFFAVTLIFKE